MNEPGFTCTPNESFDFECNTCRCDSSGTLARCTKLACNPNQRSKRSDQVSSIGQEQVNIPSKPVTTTFRSIPIKTDVKPAPVATISAGTSSVPAVKPNYYPLGTADRVVTSDELHSSNFHCTPSLSFKVACNTCWCAANGRQASFCTKNRCV